MDDGRLDALGQTIVGALAGAATGHSVAFNQLTVDVKVERIVDIVRYLQGRPGLPLRQPDRCDGGRLSRPREAVRRRLSSAVADAECAHPPARRGRRDHAGAVDHRRVSRLRLVRARDLRPLRRDLCRTSGHAAAVDRLRFRRPSRCARISRSPASSRCATTTRKSGWCTSRSGSTRNSGNSTSCRPGKAPTIRCRATKKRRRSRKP